MKTIASTFALALLTLGTSNTQVQAQDPEPNVTVTKVINASADEVWAVLRQMDDIQKYSSLIGKVEWTGDHGVGGQRKCYPPKGGEGTYTESIVHFSDEQRTYSYALIQGVPAKGMVNSFKVVDLGYKKSMIIWTSNYEQFLENPQMKEDQFLGFLNQAINEMIANVSKQALKS